MFENLLSRFTKKKILVVGEAVLDMYVVCETERISSETTIPVFYPKSTFFAAGGAGNVAMNLVAARQEAYILSVLGEDAAGEKLSGMFKEKGINTDLLFKKSDIATTVKNRYINKFNHQIFRFDEQFRIENSQSFESNITAKLYALNVAFDGIIIADYACGLMTPSFTKAVFDYAKTKEIPVFVDIRSENINNYYGATILKSNLKDLQILIGRKITARKELIDTAIELCNKFNSDYLLATCGGEGMVLVDKTQIIADEYAWKTDVNDVTGGGDTVSSYFMSAYVQNISLVDSTRLANYAAGLKVSKMGTQPVYIEEITEVNRYDKILTLKQLEKVAEANKKRRIVFTCGCFDIVHIGHIRYLKQARELGDLLIVGLNSDSSVKKIKGKNRPINQEAYRAELLSSFSFVDYVVIFDDTTSDCLIEKIRPSVFVKGGDYSCDMLPEYNTALKYGAEVKFLPFTNDVSTSNILKILKDSDN